MNCMIVVRVWKENESFYTCRAAQADMTPTCKQLALPTNTTPAWPLFRTMLGLPVLSLIRVRQRRCACVAVIRKVLADSALVTHSGSRYNGVCHKAVELLKDVRYH
jgi:hypothetical protein